MRTFSAHKSRWNPSTKPLSDSERRTTTLDQKELSSSQQQEKRKSSSLPKHRKIHQQHASNNNQEEEIHHNQPNHSNHLDIAPLLLSSLKSSSFDCLRQSSNQRDDDHHRDVCIALAAIFDQYHHSSQCHPDDEEDGSSLKQQEQQSLNQNVELLLSFSPHNNHKHEYYMIELFPLIGEEEADLSLQSNDNNNKEDEEEDLAILVAMSEENNPHHSPKQQPILKHEIPGTINKHLQEGEDGKGIKRQDHEEPAVMETTVVYHQAKSSFEDVNYRYNSTTSSATKRIFEEGVKNKPNNLEGGQIPFSSSEKDREQHQQQLPPSHQSLLLKRNLCPLNHEEEEKNLENNEEHGRNLIDIPTRTSSSNNTLSLLFAPEKRTATQAGLDYYCESIDDENSNDAIPFAEEPPLRKLIRHHHQTKRDWICMIF